MGKYILSAFLGGMLVMGIATTFAEEPQLADQEVLKAWGAPIEVEPYAALRLATELKPGLIPLTDETLDAISAGVTRDSEMPVDQVPILMPPVPPQAPEAPAAPVPPPIPRAIPEALQFPPFPTFPEFPVFPEVPAFPEMPATPLQPGMFGAQMPQ